MSALRGWRIGLFLLAGALLLGGALAWTLRDLGLRAQETAWLRFAESVYGLQVGAPVVLRGVHLGQVREIALAPPGPDGLRVPVRVELDAARLRELAGGDGGVEALVRRGMVGRLATQSLLTGQLYVDLDMTAGAPVDTSPLATPMAPDAPAEIPTVPGALADLQAQLQTVDLAGLARDLAATAQAARQWLDAPAWERTLAQTQTAAAALTRLAQAWEEQAAPIGADTLATMAEARQALQDSRQTLAELRQSADALGRAAQSWQALAAEDSVLRHDAQQALQDVSRAARALRELSESLERQPDALWRGRAPTP